jgi:single-stranded-DNA-specific exonuclease
MQPLIQKQWSVLPVLPPETDQLLSAYPGPIRQILFNRGLTSEESAHHYLFSDSESLDPFSLSGMDVAVDRICQAIKNGEPIVVYGDYDVDGVTACALMVQALQSVGAQVKGYIPNRFDEGYGLNTEALTTLNNDGTRLVITVDCGIRSPVEAAHAKSLGMDIIISDHHHPKGDIPQATAVICPKLPGEVYDNPDLAGVGIAFKIIQGLFHSIGIGIKAADFWLDLVALGTVADMVPLKGENRAMVRSGLRQMRDKGYTRAGIIALSNVAGMDITRVTAGDIGFLLGPRLNAAGRLETAMTALNLLMAPTTLDAAPLAMELNSHNSERQKKTKEIQEHAVQVVSGDPGSLIFVADPDFHSGVVGLAASRLVDLYYRPAIVAKIDDDFTRASCRSIPEFHITDALDECADLLVRHGGHAMAAGFTVANDKLDVLRSRLYDIATRILSQQTLTPSIKVDVDIPLRELRPDLIRYLDAMQPTGMGNPEAIFMTRDVEIKKAKTFGADNSHLRLTISDGWLTYDAIAFRRGELISNLPNRIDLVYTFETNNYNGITTLRLNVRDLRAAIQD